MDPTSGIQILTYSGRPICSPKFPGLPCNSECNCQKKSVSLLMTYMEAELLQHAAATLAHANFCLALLLHGCRSSDGIPEPVHDQLVQRHNRHYRLGREGQR